MIDVPKKHYQAVIPLLYLFLLAIITAVILLALVPPVSRDALTHHLAIPKLYLEHGGIYEIPELDFSYYPMNLDLLYMIPLYFGNDIIPKYIHFFFALGTGWLIYDYLNRRISKVYGLIGCLFFLSIPIIVKLSITIYVDLGLVFFSTAALLFLFRWTEEPYKIRYLIAAAIFCGLAVGTKYNGLLTLFILSAFVPLLYLRTTTEGKNSFTALKWGMVFLSIALLVCSPWFIRNYFWTGNPVFPLFKGIFNPDNASLKGGLDIFSVRHVLFHESTLQILLLPIRIFFEGQDNNPQFFDGILNPFLLILPFLAFFRIKKENHFVVEKISFALFSILFIFIATFQSGMRIRYITPIIPPLIILSVFGLYNIQSFFRNKQIGPSIAGILLLAMFAYNGNYLIEQFKLVRPLSYISGKINREKYITRFRPEYPAIQFANKNISKPNKVLCIFLGNRGYYMDFPHIFDMPFNKNSFLNRTISKAKTVDDIREILLQHDFTNILLRNDLTSKWLNNLQQHKKTTILFFQHELELMYTAGGYTLFHIKDDH